MKRTRRLALDFDSILIVFRSVLEANLGSQPDKMASEIELKNEVEIWSEKEGDRVHFLALPDGMRTPLGGIKRGR